MMLAGRRALALLAALLAGSPARAEGPASYVARFTPITPDGVTQAGPPVVADCPANGCRATVSLPINGAQHAFTVTISFVVGGAYLQMDPAEPSLGKVFDFDQGFNSALFIRTRPSGTARETFRLILSGGSAGDPGSAGPQAVAHGPVFDRKLAPDAVLRVELTATGPGS